MTLSNTQAYCNTEFITVVKKYRRGQEWRSIICKHNARWLHISRLKASAVYYSFWKTFNVNKTRLLKLGKGAGIWWVVEPQLKLFWASGAVVSSHISIFETTCEIQLLQLTPNNIWRRKNIFFIPFLYRSKLVRLSLSVAFTLV